MGYSFEPRCCRKRDNPEGRLVLSIIKELRWKGHIAGKIKNKGGIKTGGGFIKDLYLMSGLPDIIAFVPSLVFIEAKAGKNGQTDEQIEFQKFCNKAGILYIVAYDLKDIQNIIH